MRLASLLDLPTSQSRASSFRILPFIRWHYHNARFSSPDYHSGNPFHLYVWSGEKNERIRNRPLNNACVKYGLFFGERQRNFKRFHFRARWKKIKGSSECFILLPVSFKDRLRWAWCGLVPSAAKLF